MEQMIVILHAANLKRFFFGLAINNVTHLTRFKLESRRLNTIIGGPALLWELEILS